MWSDKYQRARFLNAMLHVSAWAIVFFLPFFIGQENHMPKGTPPPHKMPEPGNFRLVITLINLPLIPFFYLNAFLLVPRFFNKKLWYIYLLSIVASIVCIGFIDLTIRNIIEPENPFPVFSGGLIFFCSFVIVTSIAFHYIKQNMKAEEFRKEKEAENLKTELSFLRSQVSPHFLFNTLNNLVSLARKKSELLEPSLIKLSGLLQYMLYESDDEKINIGKEIEYLDNYIDLQKLRFGDSVKITFDKQVPSYAPAEVVPMILIPFVENAFKHGVVLIKDPEISISAVLRNNVLLFNVRNKFSSVIEEKDKSSGIGLSNVKRRLDLLYPSSRLDIVQKDDWYMVTLSINL